VLVLLLYIIVCSYSITMSSNNSNSNSNAATVRFDVGGTIYKVSQSLLEQHPNTMLARMVSETWLTEEDNERKDEPLFIDRDGERFRYVLDFMRDGPKVSLPVTVSKEGFIKDLDYFGFDNVNSDDVSMRSSYSVYADTMKKMDSLDTTNDGKGEIDRNCSVIAHYCFLKFKLTGNLTVDLHQHNNDLFHRSGHKKYQDNKTTDKLRSYSKQVWENPVKITCLNKYLNKYDLKLVKVERDRRTGYTIFHLEIDDKS
jgi:hypothetical protein